MQPDTNTPLDYLVATPEEFLAADFDKRGRLVLDQIDAVPEAWNQCEWGIKREGRAVEQALGRAAYHCGSAFCLAGWACVLAGDRIAWRAVGLGTSVSSSVIVDGRSMAIADRAKDLLGLINYTAFRASNTREHLGEILEENAEYRRAGLTQEQQRAL